MIRISENPAFRRKRDAFTLLEVLLSAVILTGLMVLILAMANRTFALWGDGERRREQQREAQSSLRVMGDDLRSAVIIAGDPSSLMIRREMRGCSLFFLVSHPDDRRQPGIRGDLCAAGYFTAPDPAGNGGWNLYRFHSSGDDVMKAVQEHSLDKLYATAAPGGSHTELLARDIAELQLSPVVQGHRGSHPEALRVTVTALGRSGMKGMPKDDSDQGSIEAFLSQKGTRLSSVVALPPPRENTQSQ